MVSYGRGQNRAGNCPHGASVKKDAVALTAKTGTAIGCKAAKSGKVDFSFKHSAFEGGAKVGFSVVKKSTFEQVYPEKKGFKTLAAGAETLTGSFNAAKGDEYLFVFAMQGKGANVSLPTELSVGDVSIDTVITASSTGKNIEMNGDGDNWNLAD